MAAACATRLLHPCSRGLGPPERVWGFGFRGSTSVWGLRCGGLWRLGLKGLTTLQPAKPVPRNEMRGDRLKFAWVSGGVPGCGEQKAAFGAFGMNATDVESQGSGLPA